MADEPKVITTIGVETFLDVGNPPLNLLRVQPGIPIDDAYEQVSILLGYIKHLIHEGDAEDDHKLLGAAEYLSVLAKALMDEIEMTKNRLHCSSKLTSSIL
ncbi:DUF3077 domain-containing protein [Pseudomonas vlassakiae]|uniref:DUF3077 domain-containing protein n=1 Tax=Pseudomonas vlassakiae TaxID=485888 RepID=UPI0021C5673B|nr:DUF3077 domain-containing protein [Pseudomonas vlassakiae]MCU0123970.1 DUF3077 domain-containing protein [Pseudomonas vlassakiae]